MPLTIRERRFTLELWELSSSLEKKDTVPICELGSFSAVFSLNSIPQAIVVPLFGTIINDIGSRVDGTVAKKATVDQLLRLSKNRSPVGVTLKVNHSFSSEESDKIDKQYWKPEINLSVQDTFGRYDTNEIFIFKGYIAPPMLDILSNNAQVRLTLYHWLSDISDISLLTTYCHTATQKEIALQLYEIPVEDKKTDNTWSIVTQTDIKLKEPKAIWLEGIKPMFMALIKFCEKDNFYNNYIATRREALINTLDRIEADDSLTLSKQNLTDDSNSINWCIAQALKSENYQNFINSTGWDKLITSYSPNFLFSIVPRVEKALIIPTPATEYIKDEDITILQDNDIFRLSTSPLTTVVLNRVICTPAVPTDTSQSNNEGSATYIELASYPPAAVQKDRSGVISTTTYPNWLNIIKPEKQQNPTKQLKIQQNYSDLVDAVARRKQALEEIAKEKKVFANKWAEFVYLTQAYNSSWLNVSTPCRMDICPGAMVCCQISQAQISKQESLESLNNNNIIKLYGTVTSVGINILPAENTSNTQFTLTNIRTEQIANDAIENPQGAIGLYTKQWSGKGVTLYD